MTDGCVPYNLTQLEISSARICAAPVKATGIYGTARPSRTKSHLLGHSPPASQAGRCVGPALYAFGLIGPSFILNYFRAFEQAVLKVCMVLQ